MWRENKYFFKKKYPKVLCIQNKVIPLHSQTGNSASVASCLAIKHRGVEQLVARQAHNLEVARSSRTPATEVVVELSG